VRAALCACLTEFHDLAIIAVALPDSVRWRTYWVRPADDPRALDMSLRIDN
jgi:hypothetical protein